MFPMRLPDEIRAKKVLLVVDIDYHDEWDPNLIAQSEERQRFISSLSLRIREMRAMGVPLVFVMLNPRGIPEFQLEPQFSFARHCIGCDRKENKLAKFLGHRHEGTFEPVFVKTHSDSFTNPKLAPYLESLGIKEILLAGCNTFACIKNTAQGAVRNGFNVTLLEDSTYPPFGSEDGWKTKEEWIGLVAAAQSGMQNQLEQKQIAVRSLV
jgi:nicotinamidase-related amidase